MVKRFKLTMSSLLSVGTLGRSLVYGCLLGMADTKASRRRHTTRPQHSQEPVEAHNYYTTKAPEYYTEADAAPSYNIKRTTPKLPSTKTTKSPEYYTYPPTYYTTKAAEYYTEPPKYYTNKAPEYYTTTCASLSLYTEAPKYYSALSYTTTTEAAKYYAAPTYYTAAAPSYYVESEYYT
ncbi:hypothetical protein DAPPUDRAFT_251776 [Daphnia pulex]|uniref:Uncharacterized protein n=1 Tax=Daphnia pulex TaxID=6669 RepID=E9H138_DAPPU|nr:hypothetical protein DAPPUDRAFT_307232 [Daphnia pulex]EFX74591.1 hypothetical protein DAPPUDRAFT_251776 [Daphnia pulex]|eukprot:EFX74563.1 hypothetical protein DAPPUDRAFT_307232 [Daphnia pulex]